MINYLTNCMRVDREARGVYSGVYPGGLPPIGGLLKDRETATRVFTPWFDAVLIILVCSDSIPES